MLIQTEQNSVSRVSGIAGSPGFGPLLAVSRFYLTLLRSLGQRTSAGNHLKHTERGI